MAASVSFPSRAVLASRSVSGGSAKSLGRPPPPGRTMAARRTVAMAVETSDFKSVGEDAYIALGRAHCFEKNDAGKLNEVFVLEAIPAGAAEAMSLGARTSYTHVIGITLGDAQKMDISSLPSEFQDARFSDNFVYRSDCAARTWSRSHAQEKLLGLMPVGEVKDDFNFNLEDKRILNFVNVVNDSDNIKQDMSIDVYNRDDKAAEKAHEDAVEAAANA